MTYLLHRARKKDPDKCKYCNENLTKPGQSKKKFCSLKCELMGCHEKKECGCWDWNKSFFKHVPYGKIRKNTKVIYAHRLSYELFNGQIPEGCVVRHKCDNYRCVNPDHLEIGTQQQNIWDGIVRNRKEVKLTWEDVCNIRKEYPSVKSYGSLGTKYGVHAKTISDIVNMKKRKNPPPK